MNLKIFVISLFATGVLVGCSGGGVSTDEESAIKDNESQNIMELVRDYSVGNIKDQSASITSQQLLVTDSDGTKSVYDLPEKEFFISIAPYVNETHP